MNVYTVDSLAKAINNLVSELIGDLKVDVGIDSSSEELSDNVKDVIYLITREALTNIQLHAEAERAEIKLDVSSKRISLFVQDDGRGLSPEEITKKREGLTRIQKHVADLRGNYEMDSHQGDGVAHSVYIPLPIAPTNQAKLETKIRLSWWDR